MHFFKVYFFWGVNAIFAVKAFELKYVKYWVQLFDVCLEMSYKIELKAPNGQPHPISHEAAHASRLLSDLMAQNDEEEDILVEIVEDLHEVTDQAVVDAIYYFESFKPPFEPTVIPHPVTSNIEMRLSAEEKKYLKETLLENGDDRKHDNLVDVMFVANFLIAESLLNLTTSWMAWKFREIIESKDKAMDAAHALRTYFNIENDWTPEQEQVLREEAELGEN